jgi:hypothetical protein
MKNVLGAFDNHRSLARDELLRLQPVVGHGIDFNINLSGWRTRPLIRTIQRIFLETP